MLRPEPLDIIIIALVAMLVFGANRLPETMRAIGRAIREFKIAVASDEKDDPSKPRST